MTSNTNVLGSRQFFRATQYVISERAPGNTDINYDIGSFWLYNVPGQNIRNLYFLSSKEIQSGGISSAVWILIGTVIAAAETLTGNDGIPVLPVGFNIDVVGGAASAIEFTDGGPGVLEAQVLVDGTSIQIVNNELVSTAGSLEYPVDNGGPAEPIAGEVAFLGTSADFPISSGLETHVGATLNEIYFEDRRFPTEFVVDPSATVGERGEYDTVQAAVTAAIAAGSGTILLRAGTYTENVTIPLNGENIQITSLGRGSTIVGNIVVTGNGNLYIKDLECSSVMGDTLNLNATGVLNVRISEVDILSGGGKGIYLQTTAADDVNLSILDSSVTSFNFAVHTQGAGAFSVQVQGSIFASDADNAFHLEGAVSYYIKESILDGNTNAISVVNNGQGSVTYSTLIGQDHAVNLVDVAAQMRLYTSILDSSTGTGNAITGTGTLTYNDITLPGSARDIGATILQLRTEWKPHGNTAGDPGVNWYDPNFFAVDADTGEVTLVTSPDIITWQDENINVNAAPFTGWFSTGTIIVTLPNVATAQDGTVVKFIQTTADVLTVQASPGQVIRILGAVSSGAGTATALTGIGTSLNLVYQDSTDTWWAESVNGSWSLA